MPVFNETHTHILQELAEDDTWRYAKKHPLLSELIAKSLIEPPDFNVTEDMVEVRISEYGKRVLNFYKAVKAGQVKTKLSQCHGCSNPC